MKTLMPNYNDCIVNLANSIMKYFDLPANHDTLKDVDEILNSRNPKNVVVMLCDGMGTNILKRALKPDDFLVKNLRRSISSVLPPTTTASTTSMTSGLYPCEHGWIGWDVYIKPEDKIVTLYTNCLKDTEIPAAEYNVARTHMPFKDITDRINNETDNASVSLYPFGENPYSDFDDLCNRIISECQKDNKKYIYGYHPNPDSLMHDLGTDSKEAVDCIKQINEKIENLSKQLEDTVLIVVADHGHMNCDTILLSDYPDLFNLLEKDIWIEGRTTTFAVKEGKKEEFVKLFNKYFSEYFILKTREEVFKENLFGYGQQHEYFEAEIGDFVSIAISNKDFRYNENSEKMVSVHAGITEDEVLIPLIIV